MNKYRKIISIILIILITSTVGFIWSNSMKSKASSSQQSSGVYDQVVEVSNKVLGKEITEDVFNVITKQVFRKLAHFTEFFILGVEVSLLFICLKRYKKFAILKLFVFGLIIACIDEMIQIFFDRGASIIDILIDYGGYVFSLLIYFLWLFICKKRRVYNQTKK